ncbi:cytochrome c-type biogenesis protein [Deinococcus terrestris]|uniref:cytochrome c-type biogenesis protein n=1 Tax=Deinococcus terrestris TaxID=2651870 RepID=UPI001D15B6B5|nr:cytochrome c-type biogenesis protein CcmH [Deinococcus terrestris]
MKLPVASRQSPARARLLPLALSLLLSTSLALTPDQSLRAEAIGDNLRCPICTGEPITQSTNDISREMLRDVREQVAAGRSDAEIYSYFAARYGNFVLLDPPKDGVGMLLWGAPLAALGAGGLVLWRFLRRKPTAAAAATPEAEGDTFDPYLAEVQRQTRRKEGA